MNDVAECLSNEDIKNIIWQQEVPSFLQDKSALDVLQYLYKHGLYTEYEVRPLAQLLKDIHRADVAGRVDTFWEQFSKL